MKFYNIQHIPRILQTLRVTNEYVDMLSNRSEYFEATELRKNHQNEIIFPTLWLSTDSVSTKKILLDSSRANLLTVFS